MDRCHSGAVCPRGTGFAKRFDQCEWALLEPFFPPASHVGRPRKWPLRRIVEAILYLLRGGLPWRMLPPCFPPVSTVRRWFYLWRDNRLWLSLNHALLLIARERTGREASPSAGVIDSQSVKTTESGGPRGYDAGKKTKGRKRHILTDTDGNLVHAVVHTADIQDRDGAPLVLAEIIKRFPWLRHVFADGGYAGDKLRDALRRSGKWTIEIVKPSDAAKGFEVLPAVGLSSGHWPGSTATAASPRTSSRPSHRLPHGSSSPQSRSAHVESQGHEITIDNYESDSEGLAEDRERAGIDPHGRRRERGVGMKNGAAATLLSHLG